METWRQQQRRARLTRWGGEQARSTQSMLFCCRVGLLERLARLAARRSPPTLACSFPALCPAQRWASQTPSTPTPPPQPRPGAPRSPAHVVALPARQQQWVDGGPHGEHGQRVVSTQNLQATRGRAHTQGMLFENSASVKHGSQCQGRRGRVRPVGGQQKPLGEELRAPALRPYLRPLGGRSHSAAQLKPFPSLHSTVLTARSFSALTWNCPGARDSSWQALPAVPCEAATAGVSYHTRGRESKPSAYAPRMPGCTAFRLG